MLVSLLSLLFAAPAKAPTTAEIPRLSCDRPVSLRLLRFEDGSALLRCAARSLARISAPG